ncbi:MAG: putative nucleic acid-binding protein [Planctomycetaceae bacterium]|jgi:predicted nucleic acid-binding protein
MYLLDTNVVSELRRAGSPMADENVIEWASNLPSSQLYISVVTVLELEMGVLRVERRDSQQGAMLRNWLEASVLPAFAERTLIFDTRVARCCAGLHIPDKRSERDAMIAATGIIQKMTVVTRNIDDFVGTGVKLLNPWE